MTKERSPLPGLADQVLVDAAENAINGYMAGRQKKALANRLPTKERATIEELKEEGRILTRTYRRAAIACFKALKTVDPEGAKALLEDKGLQRGLFVPFKKASQSASQTKKIPEYLG